MIIPARPCHICQMVAVGLRAADLAEVAATTDMPVVDALRVSLMVSKKAWVAPDHRTGLPYTIFGVAQHPSDARVGIPWLIATNAQRHNLREFLRESKRIRNEMGEGFRMLANYSDARHTESHRWLKWAGYTLCDPVPYGVEGRAFYPFYWET